MTFHRPDRVSVTSAATGAVVPTTDLKAHLRVTSTGEDNLIGSLGEAVTDWWQKRTNRALLEQDYRLTMDDWPDDLGRTNPDAIELPRAPLSSTTSVSVKYVTEAGSTKTFSSTAFNVDDGGDHDFTRIVLKDGVDWPTEALQHGGAVRVDWTAGYSTSSTGVPEGIQQGIKLMVGHWYENREGVALEGVIPRELPMAVNALVNAYRIPDLPG